MRVIHKKFQWPFLSSVLAMTELHREAPLFDKILMIKLTSGLQEARQIPLTVRIIPGIRPTTIHGQNEKLFHLEVGVIGSNQSELGC